MAAYFASLNPVNLLRSLPGGIAQGLLWGLMALGVYITFRLLEVSDLTVDGSFTTGGAVTAMLLLAGYPAWLALLVSFFAGLIAGAVTGLLHTKMGIPAILSGILTQFALYSINLRIMDGASNKAVNPDRVSLLVTLRSIPRSIVVALIFSAVIVAILYWYFGTEQGSALRATGSNPAMSRAQGINIDNMKLIGLALSNGLVALSGGLMSQYQGFADVNMGRGAIVIGLAAVIIGEVFCDTIFRKGCNFAIRMAFVVAGGAIYYVAMTFILWLKLNSNDLKLFTALIVAIFLAVPYWQAQSRNSFKQAGKQSTDSHGKRGAA